MSDKPATILVVDDDPFTAELTGMIIEMSGYEAILAEGGIDALEKLSQTPDVCAVISDMYMPLMDGIQLLAELRQQGFTQPFLLLTGDDAAPLRVAHPDVDGVLTKDEHLQEALPEMLESLLTSGMRG